ncbi:MAG TPA: hypothetical protein VGZ47_18430, partial [Gemmataceae bacterium]|nr:hypothetical protein [Gemmataceae bacterium]
FRAFFALVQIGAQRAAVESSAAAHAFILLGKSGKMASSNHFKLLIRVTACKTTLDLRSQQA